MVGLLGAITGLVTASSKLIELGFFRWGARKKAADKVREQSDRLIRSIQTEGERIQSYLKFDQIILGMDEAVVTILGFNNRWPDDNKFWESANQSHSHLVNSLTPELEGFDSQRFTAHHRGGLSQARPPLVGRINKCLGYFDAGARSNYVRELRTMQPEIGRLRVFGKSIIGQVAAKLAGYRGPNHGS